MSLEKAHEHPATNIAIDVWQAARASIDALIASQKKIDVARHNVLVLRGRTVRNQTSLEAAEASLYAMCANHLRLVKDFAQTAADLSIHLEGVAE